METKKQFPMPIDVHYITHPVAKDLFEEAYQEQMNGFLDEAIELYKKSIEACPTAQGYSFLAWAFAARGEIEMAIENNKTAIKIDPDYGNPYNDIGAYLIELGKEEDAIPWLEKAIMAKKYEQKFYPYFNLGKVYEQKNQIKKAISCYQKAINIKADFKIALDALDRLMTGLN